MEDMKNIKYSILDLVPIVQGSNARNAFNDSIKLAQHAEKWGYYRYWIAEHHSMPGIASAATSIVMSYVASATKTIRIGSGGVMLPNHSPLVIAEQFGTLEAMFPNRIDLGLGRAPRTNPATAKALRRTLDGDEFPVLLEELRYFLSSETEGKQVRAIPGEGQDIPIWLLGSSDFSAILAGRLGLPFGFASHFSPMNTLPALKIYRDSFVASEVLKKPHTMVAVNIFAANTKEKAQKIATSSQQQFLSLIRNTPGQMPPPVDNMDLIWNEREKMAVMSQLSNTIIGTYEEVKASMERLISSTGADEIIINTATYDIEDRLRSYEIISKIIS